MSEHTRDDTNKQPLKAAGQRVTQPVARQIELLEQAFDGLAKVQSYQASLPAEQSGAMSLFVGTMRDFNQGQQVRSLWLEHYPPMTQRYIAAQIDKVCQQHAINAIYIAHRVGEVYPGDTIVVVAVWAAHRSDAMAANHYLVEQLKSRAPFWKKEQLADHRAQWLSSNTPGAKPLSY